MEEFTDPNNQQVSAAGADGVQPVERKVTIEPLHEDIQAEDMSDAQIAAMHVNSGAIGNIDVDREVTGTPENAAGYAAHPDIDPEKLAQKAHESKGPHRSHKGLIPILLLLTILAVVLYIIYRLLFPA